MKKKVVEEIVMEKMVIPEPTPFLDDMMGMPIEEAEARLATFGDVGLLRSWLDKCGGDLQEAILDRIAELEPVEEAPTEPTAQEVVDSLAALATLEELFNRVEDIADVHLLEECEALAEGEVRRALEDRRKTILRAAPDAGRCIKSELQKLDVLLTEEQIVAFVRQFVELRKAAQLDKETYSELLKGARLRESEADKGLVKASVGVIEKEVTVEWILTGGIVRKWRTDTNVLMEERPATDREIDEHLQEKIQFEAEEAKVLPFELHEVQEELPFEAPAEEPAKEPDAEEPF